MKKNNKTIILIRLNSISMKLILIINSNNRFQWYGLQSYVKEKKIC